MPTSPTASDSSTKAPARSAGKRTSAKATGRASTQAKATRARAARTRTGSRSQSQTATRGRLSVRSTDVFGDYAERAVLIPVGAALIARDRVVSTVGDTISIYSSSSKAQAQLRRFERRGATARSRLEREVRKTRVRVERDLRQRRRGVERELRQRRREIEKTVSELEARRDAIAKNGSDIANRVPDIANRVQERVLNLV